MAVIANSSGVHFRSVGKNYNINYNSNTNTNLDFSKLYRTISEHLHGSEIKVAPTLCPGGQCSQLYEHLAASFSSDQDDDEQDYFYDYVEEGALFPKEAADSSIPSTQESDRIVKLDPISDDSKLEILELDAVEAPAFPIVPLVNQSDQIVSVDSITVERSSESDILKPLNQTQSGSN